MKLVWMGVLLVALCGCSPLAREPDELSLVRVLGVDGGQGVELTAVCGVSQEGEILRGVAAGEDFEEALEEVPWCTTQELSLTSVSHLVVGEGANLEELLLHVLQDEELGASATVWVVSGQAQGTLNGCADPAADLELLNQRGVDAPTVVETLAQLSTYGEVTLPQVACQGERLVETGQQVWEVEQ